MASMRVRARGWGPSRKNCTSDISSGQLKIFTTPKVSFPQLNHSISVGNQTR